MYQNNKIVQRKTSKRLLASLDIRTYFKGSRIKSIWLYNQNRQIYKWNRLGNPEIGLTIYEHIINDNYFGIQLSEKKRIDNVTGKTVDPCEGN